MKLVAAMAAYNCAVLLEYSGQHNKVKYYLEKSYAIEPLPATESMLFDYRLYKALH